MERSYREFGIMDAIIVGCIMVIAAFTVSGFMATVEAVQPKPVVTMESQLKEVTQRVNEEIKARRSGSATTPFSCEVLYDLLQATQTLYLEQCPGV